MIADAQPSLELAGTVLHGRYRIERFVQRGGQGHVFEAVDVTSGARLAVKVLAARDGAASEAVVLEESRALREFRHPHVVPVLDVGLLPAALGACPFIVTAWCEGPTLAAALARSPGGIGLPLALQILRPLLAALAALHDAGVVHRDLKPSNILLRDGHLEDPQLIDFGIAKLASSDDAPGDTRTTSAVTRFTPAYAAPEQVACARTGPWTDVHAIALIFSELVTGQSPYANDDVATAVSPTRPSPAAFGVDVGALEAVMLAALALSPRERPRDAAALLTLVDRATQPSDAPPSVALPSTNTSRVEVPRSRRRGVAIIAGAAALGLFATVARQLGRTAELPPHDAPTTPEHVEIAPTAEPRELSEPARCVVDDATIERSAATAGFTLVSTAQQRRASEYPAVDSYVFVANDTRETAALTVMDSSALVARLGADEVRRRQRDQLISSKNTPVAYRIRGPCMLLLETPRAGRKELLDAITAGEAFDLAGDLLDGPDPLGNPALVAVPLPSTRATATTLDELQRDEFESRASKAGWTPIKVVHAGPSSTIALERELGAGVLVTWAPLGSRADGLVAVRSLPKPHAYALGEHVGVWAYPYGVGVDDEAVRGVVARILGPLAPVIEVE